MDRRTFNTAVMSAAASSLVGCATGRSAGSSRTAFYQSVGDRLTHWDLDVEGATLARRDTITVPSNVQYLWPHPSRKYLYVSTSDAAAAPDPQQRGCHGHLRPHLL